MVWPPLPKPAVLLGTLPGVFTAGATRAPGGGCGCGSGGSGAGAPAGLCTRNFQCILILDTAAAHMTAVYWYDSEYEYYRNIEIQLLTLSCTAVLL